MKEEIKLMQDGLKSTDIAKKMGYSHTWFWENLKREYLRGNIDRAEIGGWYQKRGEKKFEETLERFEEWGKENNVR